MRVVVWVTEASWPVCVDAARDWAPRDAEVELLHVTGDDVAAAAHGAFAGLLGRGRPHERDPGEQVETLAATAAGELLAAATERLGRPATSTARHGRIEREVVSAVVGAGLLICARDGDPTRTGPHSLAPPTRFVVDHAPCPVLLVWPQAPPGDPLPPAPPHPGPPHPPHHPPHHPH